MRLFNKINLLGNPSVILVAFIIGLCVPNVVLSITEHLPIVAAAANVLLPLGVYTLLLTIRRSIAPSILLMIPIVFFCAFQIVLFFLYGGSIIGVDMFLNVVTTSSNEVGELLHNLLPALMVVFILYLPALIWAVVCLIKRNRLSKNLRHRFRNCGIISTGIGLIALILSFATVSGFKFSRDIFPVNVIKNLTLAVDRIKQNNHYPETSKSFTFSAVSTHSDTEEVYVVVIGETARADSYGMLGYNRDTTPLLGANSNAIAFSHVLSESNTTHKSVPMLLSLVDAENYSTINSQKSIITAFKEAGFATAFISSQPPNRSYTDYFGNEADYVKFINADPDSQLFLPDDALLKELDKALAATSARKRVVFMHTYGSHFSYSDRYPRRFAHFLPDSVKDASSSNKSILINAYDNTIRHTDFILDQVIRRLQALNAVNTAMLYVPDHGEDLFDDNRQRFLHASPTPTYWQLHVPMIIWMSDSYKASYPDHWEQALCHKESQISSSHSFAVTVLDMAGISSPKVPADASVVSPRYSPSPRYYISDRNECLPLLKSGLKEIDLKLMQQSGITY